MIIPKIIITNLLPVMVWCQQYHDAPRLINRLSDFYRFDHHIFLMDSSTDLNCWFVKPKSLTTGTELTNATPRTVLTFDDLSQNDVSTTARALFAKLGAISSKNTLVVMVIEGLKIQYGAQLSALVDVIRVLNRNAYVGVFYTHHFSSVHNIEHLSRWSARILNIFTVFYLSGENGEPASLNIFKYDPFDPSHLINLTRSDPPHDYFLDKVPNYRHHFLKVVNIPEVSNTFNEIEFLKTIRRVFNASISMTNIGCAESLKITGFQADILLHEKYYDQSALYSFPHRQVTLVLVVPHAQPYSDFMAYLQNGSGTWALLFIYALIVVVSSSLLLMVSRYLHQKKILFFQCVADVVNLLMNDDAAIRYSRLHRADVFVIVPLTFTGLIVMNGIVSLFQSYLTSPIYQSQIDSIEDLYKSSLPIVANELDWKDKFLQLLQDKSKHDGWTDRVHGMNVDELTNEYERFNNSIAFFVFSDYAQTLLAAQKLLNLKAYHLVANSTFGTHFAAYAIRWDYPFAEHLNDLIHRLSRAGLIQKWLQQNNEFWLQRILKSNANRQTNIAEASDVNEFSVPTVVWLGWFLSVVAFICELIWNKMVSRQHIVRRIRGAVSN